MSRISGGVTLWVKLIAWLALTIPLRALPIYKFDAMADQDQDRYLAELVHVAENALRADGRPQDAAKVSQLFTTNADNAISINDRRDPETAIIFPSSH